MKCATHALCNSCSLSSFTSHIQSSLFCNWKHTVSCKLFHTQVFSVSTEKLVLPCPFVVCSLAFAVTDTALCQTLLSLEPTASRILHAAPAVMRPGTPLTSPSTAQPLTLAACFLATLSLEPVVLALGSFPHFGAPWSSTMPPFLGRDRETTTMSLVFLCVCRLHSS